MAKLLVLAEKPSVATKLKDALLGRAAREEKAVEGKVTYYVGERGGDTLIIAPLAGHVYNINYPQEHTKAWCVAGDTKVLLNSGDLLPIKQIISEKRTRAVSLDCSKLKITASTISKYITTKSDVIQKIKIGTGRKIATTQDHLFLTFGEQGQVWVPARRIRRGDDIAVPRALPFFGTASISDNEIKLLAYFISEGALTQSPRFSNKDTKILRDFGMAAKRAYPDLDLWVGKKRKTGVREVAIVQRGTRTANPCKLYLERMGLWGKKAPQKAIPQIVFSLPERKLALFLNRLFSCEGHISIQDGEITLYSSSQSIPIAIQHLLLRFSIISRIGERRRRYPRQREFEVRISEKSNVIRFLKKIGWFGRGRDSAKRLLQRLDNMTIHPRISNPHLDVVPMNVWGVVNRVLKKKKKSWNALGKAVFGKDNRWPYRRMKATYAPSRTTLLKVVKALRRMKPNIKSGEIGLLERISKADVLWDVVVSNVRLAKACEVYDLSVPAHHTFVANDMFVHNTYPDILPPDKLVFDLEEGKKPYALAVKKILRVHEPEAVVVATDMDIEGSALGANVLRMLCELPADYKPTGAEPYKFYRMAFSALTKEEIVRAFESLQPLDYDRARAGFARSVVDLEVGACGTRAVTRAARSAGMRVRVLSIGRVQAPTLAALLTRHDEIKAFKPTPYFEVWATFHTPAGDTFDAVYVDPTKAEHRSRVMEREKAEAIVEDCQVAAGGRAAVARRTASESPPPPFHLGALERAAFGAFGMSPSRAKALAEQLYHDGVLSYPRTGGDRWKAGYRKREYFESIFDKLARYEPLADAVAYVRGNFRWPPVEGSHEDDAHPALHPVAAPKAKMDEAQARVYDLVCLPYGQEVLCADGMWRKIGDMVKCKKSLAVVSVDDNLKSAHDDVMGYHTTYTDTLVEIRTKSGKKVLATPDHSILTMIRSGPSWTRARDISTGDWIATIRKYNYNSKKINLWKLLASIDRRRLRGAKKKLRLFVDTPRQAKKEIWAKIKAEGVQRFFAKHGPHTYSRARFMREKVPFKVFMALGGARAGGKSRCLIMSAGGKSAQTTARVPQYIDARIARLFGLLCSDGYVRYSGIEFTNTDKKMCENFSSLIMSCFGVTSRVRWCPQVKVTHADSPARSKNGTNGVYRVSVGSRILGGLFGALGRTSSKTFQLSPLLYTMSKKNIREFIGGVIDGDGHIGSAPYISCFNPKFRATLHKLLLGIGVLSRAKKTSVYINSDPRNLKRLLNTKMLKRLALARLLTSKSVVKTLSYGGNYADVIPHVGQIITEARRAQNMTRRELSTIANVTISNQEWGGASIKRPHLQNIAEVLANSTISTLAYGDILWEKIRSVKTIRKRTKVFDLSTTPNHNFCANGVVVHNCRRMLASFCPDCQLNKSRYEAAVGPHRFVATGVTVADPGYRAVYPYVKAEERELPALDDGAEVELAGTRVDEKMTKGPPAYNEASLIKWLEEKNCGTKSTRAAVIETLQKRGYFENPRHIELTPLGEGVGRAIGANVPKLASPEFTAELQRALEDIEAGRADHAGVISRYLAEFEAIFGEFKAREAEIGKGIAEAARKPTAAEEEKCSMCGSAMVRRTGRYGPFLSCSRYPECKGTMPLPKEGGAAPDVGRFAPRTCPQCQATLVFRTWRTGRVLVCPNWPKCRFFRPLPKKRG